MQIGIHHAKGSFSDRWINFCIEKKIPYKLVNCYDNNIISQVEDCSAVVWHHHHSHPKDILFAKELLYSLERIGKIVFPDFYSSWHFNDKIGQKYLLELLNMPLVPTSVFYGKKTALAWAESASYPKVFKLRCGAGSMNVKLVKDKQSAVSLIHKAFGTGFSPYPPLTVLKDRIRFFKEKKASLMSIGKALARWVFPSDYVLTVGKEKGYVYFQEFIPLNKYDIRVIVINKKAIAMKRLVRSGDFRASGSRNFEFLSETFPLEIIDIAFQASERIKSQCVALDFILKDGAPMITEISYGFSVDVYDRCGGYWDEKLRWHKGKIDLCAWMFEMILENENH